MSISDLDFLRHIRDEIDFISNHSQDLDVARFKADGTTRRAFVRSLEIIGEAAKKVSPEFKQQHPEIEWRAMAGMRDS